MPVGDDDDTMDIWANECTEYIICRIFLTFPKLNRGDKFDKIFQTDANRLVFHNVQ